MDRLTGGRSRCLQCLLDLTASQPHYPNIPIRASERHLYSPSGTDMEEERLARTGPSYASSS